MSKKFERAELVEHYVELMGSDAQERGFYKNLASMTDAEIIDGLIHLAYYYKEEYNKL
jgi:hypothetical protein